MPRYANRMLAAGIKMLVLNSPDFERIIRPAQYALMHIQVTIHLPPGCAQDYHGITHPAGRIVVFGADAKHILPVGDG